jgi:hypothetical protein
LMMRWPVSLGYTRHRVRQISETLPSRSKQQGAKPCLSAKCRCRRNECRQ